MHHKTKIILIIIILMAAAVASDSAVVTRVIDGDTIELDDGTRVRLIGVDCPEMAGHTYLKESLAEKARQFVSDLCLGQTVRLEYDRDTMDIYDRILAYVFTQDGLLINKEIIRRGYGFAYLKYPFQKRQEFIAAELEAREKQLGVWSPGALAYDQPSSKTADDTVTVYITRTGTKYHRADCEHLARTKIPINLLDAVNAGYRPCLVCSPPILEPEKIASASLPMETERHETGESSTDWIQIGIFVLLGALFIVNLTDLVSRIRLYRAQKKG